MKIREIRAAAATDVKPLGRRVGPTRVFDGAKNYTNPRSRYLEFVGQGRRSAPDWNEVICVVTAEDDTWGMGMTAHSGPVVPIINDYLAPLIKNDNAFAIEQLTLAGIESAT